MRSRALGAVLVGAAALSAGCAACDGRAVVAGALAGDLAQVHALCELGDPIVPSTGAALPSVDEAFAAVAPVLSSSDPFARLTALEGLRRLAERAPHAQRDRYPGLFDPLLADPDAAVRWRAAWTLGRLERGAPGLTAALDDPVARVAERAAWALGRVGDPAAVPSLIAALEREPLVARTAAAALERITGALGLGADPEAWRAWRRGASPTGGDAEGDG